MCLSVLLYFFIFIIKTVVKLQFYVTAIDKNNYEVFHIWILFSKQWVVVLICKTLKLTEFPNYSFHVEGCVYVQDTINACFQTPVKCHSVFCQ